MYVHWHLAPNFDSLRGTGSPSISQGELFRVETGLALVSLLLVAVVHRSWTALLAFLVTGGGTVFVLLYRYVDVGAVGPLPNMYDPTWYAEKTVSAIGEGVAAVAALVLFFALGGVRITDRSLVWNSDLIETLELDNLIAQAVVTMDSAKNREESLDECRVRARDERFRNGKPIAELVDLNHVWDEPAASALPDNSSGKDHAQQQQSSGGDLPVAFAENEIGVTFVPFATGFDVGIRVHRTLSCGLSEKRAGWAQGGENFPD